MDTHKSGVTFKQDVLDETGDMAFTSFSKECENPMQAPVC
ncbi:hypothetical protein BVRB_3g066860 [Beta vulgaris subsp. vulgaris]|nr:hypothetical protein BVRB_3g066860 [Beta vulgaris subsp. vulgaris]